MSYTEDEKASALTALAANAGNIQKTAKALSLPATTLRQWRDGEHVTEAVTKKRDIKKSELADLFEAEVRAAFGVLPGKRADASYKDTVTGIGILTDKMQLLRNLPTAITNEYSDLSDEQLESRIAALERGEMPPS